MLGFNTKILGLQEDGDVFNIADPTLLFRFSCDPVSKLIVGRVATTLSILILVVSKDKLLLEVVWQLLLTSLDSLSRHINSPFIILDLGRSIKFFGLCLDTASEFIVTTGLDGNVTIVWRSVLGIVLVIWTVAIVIVSVATILLSGLASGPLLGFVLLALLWLVLEDETAQLETEVDIGPYTASLAVKYDETILDNNLGFWVLALLAQNELIDETIEVFLELGGLMGTVDDPSIVGGVSVGLGSQLEAEVLDDIGSRTSQRVGDTAEIDNDRLDAISFAFDLGLESLHLVSVEGVLYIATDIDSRHDCGWMYCSERFSIWFLYGTRRDFQFRLDCGCDMKHANEDSKESERSTQGDGVVVGF